MIAADKCLQLAQSLHSIARQIAYEDVQNAARPIAQCIANVFTVADVCHEAR
jgi:hypothetical protein